MKAFVAGATGFVGREVVRALREREVETIAHVRPDSARLSEWQERFSALGAIMDTTEWQSQAMTVRLVELEPTIVFALLGTTRKRARRSPDRDESYRTVDYGLTRILLDAAAATAGKPRFVYLSSVGVSDRSRSDYLKARADTERAVQNSGLPYLIARPSFITGPGRDDHRPGERMAAKVVDGALALADLAGAHALRNRYRSTTSVILAEALVHWACAAGTEDRILDGEALRTSR